MLLACGMWAGPRAICSTGGGPALALHTGSHASPDWAPGCLYTLQSPHNDSPAGHRMQPMLQTDPHAA